MLDLLNQLMDSVISLLEQFFSITEPSWVILLNAVVILFAIVFAASRLRGEMRGVQWSKLPIQQRRELVYGILEEAYEFAEWLYSHLDGLSGKDDPQRIELNEQKKAAALLYARRELNAMGASAADLVTAESRIEAVCRVKKAGGVRYNQVTLRRPS